MTTRIKDDPARHAEPTPRPLRLIGGGQQGRACGPATVDAPPHLSALAAKVWRELAPACAATETLDAGGCEVLGQFCALIACAWGTGNDPELGRQLADGLKLPPASRRRLLALSENKKPRPDAWKRS